MYEDDRTRLRHMLDAAHDAASFMRGRDRSSLDSDRMLMLGSVITFTVDQGSQTILDFSIGSTIPDIGKLGPIQQFSGPI